MRALDRVFAKVSDISGALLLIAIVMVITLQIFARTVLGEAFIWPEELAVFLSIYLVFLGAAYNARQNTHIKVSFFANRMPRPVRFGVTFTAHVFLLCHLGLLLWSMVPLSEAPVDLAQSGHGNSHARRFRRDPPECGPDAGVLRADRRRARSRLARRERHRGRHGMSARRHGAAHAGAAAVRQHPRRLRVRHRVYAVHPDERPAGSAHHPADFLRYP